VRLDPSAAWVTNASTAASVLLWPAITAATPALPAGALRAASGYGFLRIQAWAERCAAALARDGRTVGHPNEPRLRQWMDELFLRVLTADPTRAPEFFLRLAGIVPSAAFVRFLSDQASVADIARIVTALPPWPFLRALGPQRSVAERTA